MELRQPDDQIIAVEVLRWDVPDDRGGPGSRPAIELTRRYQPRSRSDDGTDRP
jgi:hypothetical protein